MILIACTKVWFLQFFSVVRLVTVRKLNHAEKKSSWPKVSNNIEHTIIDFGNDQQITAPGTK